MAGQKVELKPSDPAVTSRPLKTGTQFLLVLPRHRFVYRHWDKEKYLPGEEAELILEGEGIGKGPFEFEVEVADTENGPWSPCATVKATVQGDKATAKYKIPKGNPHGHLTKAEWKRTKGKPGDRIGLHVEADGYEGGWLGIYVEFKDPEDGQWHIYTRWQGHIESGKFDDVFQVPEGKPKTQDRPRL